jgi:hypothetical protein
MSAAPLMPLKVAVAAITMHAGNMNQYTSQSMARLSYSVVAPNVRSNRTGERLLPDPGQQAQQQKRLQQSVSQHGMGEHVGHARPSGG